MVFKVLAVAAVAFFGALFGAPLTVLAEDLQGPKELPPPDYKGQQYVDSSGCVFLRAGLGGQVTWVPRIDRQRRQLCGYPTQAEAARDLAKASAPEIVPAPAPAEARAAVPSVAATSADAIPPVPARAKRAAAPAARSAAAKAAVSQVAGSPVLLGGGVLTESSGFATGGQVLCPPASPILRSFPLRNGGTTLLCTDGNGALERAVVGIDRNGRAFAPIVPHGYVSAWQDDRLNPRRGMGTVAGQLAQDQVWTRSVPARLVSDTPKPRKAAKKVYVSASNAPNPAVKHGHKSVVATSTSTAPKAPLPKGNLQLFVQVGSFTVASNASGASARLAGIGLPVSAGRARINGRSVQVVYAGPFGTAAAAQAALAAARQAGFADAFIR